jgi:hypothetical protein
LIQRNDRRYLAAPKVLGGHPAYYQNHGRRGDANPPGPGYHVCGIGPRDASGENDIPRDAAVDETSGGPNTAGNKLLNLAGDADHTDRQIDKGIQVHGPTEQAFFIHPDATVFWALDVEPPRAIGIGHVEDPLDVPRVAGVARNLPGVGCPLQDACSGE